jgi:universal stress protein E
MRRVLRSYQFKRILVAVADPAARSTSAVRRAAALAHVSGASIELLNAIPSPMSAGVAHAESERFTRYQAAENRRLLERMANRLRREEIIVNTHVETGYPAHEAILRQVRSSKADLLIIEARKHNLFARLLLTQTDFELIRHCPVALLIVKGRAAWRRPHILSALDPFHANDKPNRLDGEIVAAASALAALAGGTLHAVHVYRSTQRLVPGMDADPVGLAENPMQGKAHQRAIRAKFGEALGRYGISKSRGHLLHGDPASELAKIARSMRAALVVMGAMSRSGMKRMFIGNTAERVLDGLKCDVLIVKLPRPSPYSRP